MFCIHCGKQITDKALFCPYCGKSQTAIEKNIVSEPEEKYEEKPVSVLDRKNKKGPGFTVAAIAVGCVIIGLVVVAIFVNRNKASGKIAGLPSDEVSEEEGMIGEDDVTDLDQLQSTDVPYDFEAPESDDEKAFDLASVGTDNGDYVDIKPIFELYNDMGSAFYPAEYGEDGGDEHYTGMGRYFHGYSVEITSLDNTYEGSVVIRGFNSNKVIAIVPVTIFDDNAVCSYGEGSRDGDYYVNELGKTYVKSIDNLKKVLEVINSTDNYDDADECPLEHKFIYHVHPSSKKTNEVTSKPEDFSPYDDYFDIKGYFDSWKTDGSISYSVSHEAYESFGLKADQHYCASYTFNGWRLDIMYTDQEGLWGYESGSIKLRDGHTTDVIASFDQPSEEHRRKVVIDEDGNTTYEGTLEILTQIMPILVNERENDYCPLDGLGIEHNH